MPFNFSGLLHLIHARMEEKKSIIVYADWINVFEELDDAEAGKLIKHFFRYVNDLNPEPPDKLTKIAFEPIKLTLKRDLKKWELIREKRSEAGKISAEKRKQNSTNPTSVDFVQQNSTNPTVSVSVNDSVNVNVINKNIFSFRKSLCIYGFDEKLIDEWLKVRKSKKSVNTETALNTFIKEVEKSNLPKNQILEMCVSNSWAGFKNEWLTNKNGNNGNTKTADERLQEAKSRILGEDSEFSESKPNNENFEFTSYEDVGKF